MYYIKGSNRMNMPITPAETSLFISEGFIDVIVDRMRQILSSCAPIERNDLFAQVLSSFSVRKSIKTTRAVDKAFWRADIKTTKQGGKDICWSDEQVPETYYGFVSDPYRKPEKILQIEAKNALCYSLQEYGSFKKDDLFEVASTLLGFKKQHRIVKQLLEDALEDALKSGEILIDDDTLSLGTARAVDRSIIPESMMGASVGGVQNDKPNRRSKLKIAAIVVIALIGVFALKNTIDQSLTAKRVQAMQDMIYDDLADSTEVALNNFGTLTVRVPNEWLPQKEIDDSLTTKGTYEDPVTVVHRVLKDENNRLIAAEDVRYLGEEGTDKTDAYSVARSLAIKLGSSKEMVERENPNAPHFASLTDEGTWFVPNINGSNYRIDTVVVNLAESYYAVSSIFLEEYYSDELFAAIIDNAGLEDYDQADLVGLEATYDGSKRVGTIISNDTPGLIINAIFDNGLSKDVTEKVRLANNKTALRAGESNDYAISYTFSDVTLSETLSIDCPSELTALKVFYDGPTVRETKIEDLSNFTVKATYATPGESDVELDVTGDCSLANPGALEANKSYEASIAYGEKRASYNIECSTKMALEVEYKGANTAGTAINDLHDFTVTAIYSDESFRNGDIKEDVTAQAVLENTATLQEGREDTFRIVYNGTAAQCSINCPVTQRSSSSEESVSNYIVNRNTKKFHHPWCHSVDRMKESNKWYYEGTREWLIEHGYSPCQNCYP